MIPYAHDIVNSIFLLCSNVVRKYMFMREYIYLRGYIVVGRYSFSYTEKPQVRVEEITVEGVFTNRGFLCGRHWECVRSRHSDQDTALLSCA